MNLILAKKLKAAAKDARLIALSMNELALAHSQGEQDEALKNAQRTNAIADLCDNYANLVGLGVDLP